VTCDLLALEDHQEEEAELHKKKKRLLLSQPPALPSYKILDCDPTCSNERELAKMATSTKQSSPSVTFSANNQHVGQ